MKKILLISLSLFFINISLLHAAMSRSAAYNSNEDFYTRDDDFYNKDEDFYNNENFHDTTSKYEYDEKTIEKLHPAKLGVLLQVARTMKNLKLVTLITQSSQFQNIPQEFIEDTLLHALENSIDDPIMDNIITAIVKTNRFKNIQFMYDLDLLSNLFQYAAATGNTSLMKIIMDSSIFKKHSQLEALFFSALDIASKNGHKKIIAMILNNPNYDYIHHNLFDVLLNAAKNGHESILRMVLHKRFAGLQRTEINYALGMALAHKHEGCANWIRAYTALKPEFRMLDEDDMYTLVIKQNLGKISHIEHQIVQAYDDFIHGNPNNLRNLILPIGKSKASNIYTLSTKPDSESLPMDQIASALFRLFQRDRIKPLLLALAQTETQRTAARDLIKHMGLTKKDIAASKIQARFKGARTRKRLANDKARAKQQKKEDAKSKAAYETFWQEHQAEKAQQYQAEDAARKQQQDEELQSRTDLEQEQAQELQALQNKIDEQLIIAKRAARFAKK